MKVLLINTYDKGGAANACIRLHQGLLANKIESLLLVKHKTKKELRESYSFQPDSLIYDLIYQIKLKIENFKPVWSKLNFGKNRFLKSRPKGLEMYSYPNSICDITKSKLYKEAEIIHLHWVADFLDWESFFKYNKKPVIWTLHDQNPFLGGEHYGERYLGIDEKGFPIPRKYTLEENMMDEKLISFKKELLKNVQNLHVVSPSKWLMQSSQSSDLFYKFTHHHIPYGLNTEIFKPYEKTVSRKFFGLPEDKIIFLFVSEVVKHNRKGFDFLQLALSKLNKIGINDFLICTVGSNSNKDEFSENVHHLGTLATEDEMTKAYSAADCYVITSIEDNFPNTVIESLLCGCPVIGFPTGGVIDAVQSGVNGILSSEVSVNDLVDLIQSFIKKCKHFDRDKISTDAKQKYSIDKQAKEYIEIYKQICMYKNKGQ